MISGDDASARLSLCRRHASRRATSFHSGRRVLMILAFEHHVAYRYDVLPMKFRIGDDITLHFAPLLVIF